VKLLYSGELFIPSIGDPFDKNRMNIVDNSAKGQNVPLFVSEVVRVGYTYATIETTKVLAINLVNKMGKVRANVTVSATKLPANPQVPALVDIVPAAPVSDIGPVVKGIVIHSRKISESRLPCG